MHTNVRETRDEGPTTPFSNPVYPKQPSKKNTTSGNKALLHMGLRSIHLLHMFVCMSCVSLLKEADRWIDG